jgi:hypothetical protein
MLPGSTEAASTVVRVQQLVTSRPFRWVLLHIRRGPVSYDEDSGRQGGYNKRGGYGGRGGGRGGGGRGGGGGYGQRRTLSPEAAAVNDALAAATSWRQLNTVLEQQVGPAVCWVGCGDQHRWVLDLADGGSLHCPCCVFREPRVPVAATQGIATPTTE